MLRKLFFVMVVSGLFGVVYATEEATKSEAPKPEGGADCREEFKKVCGSVEKGEGRIIDCIEKNLSSFSPKCAERAKMRQEKHAKMKACHEEMKKLCGSVEKGEGRKKKCMEENKSKLSSECQAMGERMKERHEKRAAARKEKSAATPQ